MYMSLKRHNVWSQNSGEKGEVCCISELLLHVLYKKHDLIVVRQIDLHILASRRVALMYSSMDHTLVVD